MLTRSQITRELGRVARRHGVKILFACESGSRAWGFASRDSDYDVRFIYARPSREYLRLDRPRDVIEEPITGEFDISGWDIFKACHLASKSNPPLREWLGSPIVYTRDEPFTRKLRLILDRHFSHRACGEHYLSMAKNNFRTFVGGRRLVRRKKYLYVLRSVAAVLFLLRHRRFPPTNFEDTLAAIRLPAPVDSDVQALLEEKKAEQELGVAPRIEILGDYLQDCLNRLPRPVHALPSRVFPKGELNKLIWKTLSEN